jgi:arylsulfatase A-like enzyme
MDEQIGVLVERLRERQLLEKTILVILADHGEGFREHGLTSHGNSLYRELVHVPLVVRYPASVPAGARIRSVVSLTDVAATLLELADPRSSASLPGSSFARMWKGDAPQSQYALSWLESAGRRDGPFWQPEHVSVTNDRFTLIARNDGRRELYDWQSDPGERVNLADSVQQANTRASLEALLEPWTGAWRGDTRVGGR